jgi:hypothetical protein
MENHSNDSKRPSQNGGATSQPNASGPGETNEGQSSLAGDVNLAATNGKGRAPAASSYSGTDF